MEQTMDYNEQFLADIVEHLLAISRSTLRATAKEIGDGGYQVVINGAIPSVFYGGMTPVAAIQSATGYTDVTVDVGDKQTVVVLQ